MSIAKQRERDRLAAMSPLERAKLALALGRRMSALRDSQAES